MRPVTPDREAAVVMPRIVSGATGLRPDAARVRLFVPSPAWGGRRRRELLLAAAAAAVLFHLAMVGAIVEVPGMLPVLRAPPPAPPPPEAEVVMVKQDTPTVGGAAPPKTQAKTPAPRTAQARAKSGGGAADTLQAPQGPAVPRPADRTAPTEGDQDHGHDASTSQPPAPASTEEVNLDIDGQPGWGLADPRAIAASPDDRFINKPAGYPKSALLRGQDGTVYLDVLIGPDGRAETVRIARSSGHEALDRAARDAVAAWHFRPAIENGVAVESQYRTAYHFILGG